MAMPRRGSRNIVVDGVAYRWRFGGQGLVGKRGNLLVMVEAVDNKETQTLCLDTSALAFDGMWPTMSGEAERQMTEIVAIVTRTDIENYIRFALKAGWRPTEKGKPFVLAADATIATRIRRKQIMAMAKKGSRVLLVDDVPYRWRIRGRETAAQASGETNLSVAIEAVVDGDICTLVVDPSVARPSKTSEEDAVSVTPAVVEAYVRLALKKGWKPTQKGKPFLLVADESMASGKI
jgi:hypothetical protein